MWIVWEAPLYPDTFPCLFKICWKKKKTNVPVVAAQCLDPICQRSPSRRIQSLVTQLHSSPFRGSLAFRFMAPYSSIWNLLCCWSVVCFKIKLTDCLSVLFIVYWFIFSHSASSLSAFGCSFFSHPPHPVCFVCFHDESDSCSPFWILS